jgi:hypothetical protein
LPGSCAPAAPPKHSTNEQNVRRTQRPTIATPAIYKLMPRGSTKDAGTSMRLPEPVWAHGGIQLVMYTLPLPHTLEHTPARNFALWRTLKTKKRANKPKRSCQTLYPSHYPQLTKLEQIGQSIVQPIILLFGSISVHAVGNFSHSNLRGLRETKFRKSCFL